MSSHHPNLLFCRATRLVTTVLLYFLLSPAVSCFNPPPPPTSPQGLAFEEKARIGSTPPSCHNKCNGCHPCMAVQVPTLPSRKPATNSIDQFVDPYPSGNNNRYSNYKPLGWKCSCGDHFYNP